MNPFLWTGPSFLILYFVLGYAVCYLVNQRIKRIESESGYELTEMVKDPYRIAFLRAGPVEALQVATIVLIDRGLLRLEGDMMQTVSADAIGHVRHEIERDVLKLYRERQGNTFELSNNAESLPSCRAYQAQLAEHTLRVGAPVRRRRGIVVACALILLLGVAGTKAAVAIATGHYNIIFLALLSGCFYLYLRALRNRADTWSSDNLLADLRILFERLSLRCSRLSSGDGTGDLALLAAIFGIGALPADAYPEIFDLYPGHRPPSHSKSDGSSSSGGDGGGDGGGCGGGGGGCGGCGGS